MTYIKYPLLVCLVALVALAQMPVKPVDGNHNELRLAAAGPVYSTGMIVVPASDTLLTATTTKIQAIHCGNNTAGAVTLTISDNQVTPRNYFPAVSVAANSSLLVQYGTLGMPYAGIRWAAGSSNAIYCHIVGVQ